MASLSSSRSSAGQAVQLERLVIVGGGMAAYGLCRRLVECDATGAYSISVLGEEPRTAYDRVHVSKLFSGRAHDDLLLAPRDWYAQHAIRFQTHRKIVKIDREERCVVDSNGGREPFDRLVLATGSYPMVPPIPGADGNRVFVYRTIEDLEAIRDYVTAHSSKNAAVIGGGLLGLEAARVMIDLGVRPSVIEIAPGLMPRQLDSGGARVLKERVEQLGVEVCLTRRTERIEQLDCGVQLHFQNADPLHVDLVVVAAGVRPRDELAEPSGLELGPRGGFAVNRHLLTNDPRIFAIGECASVEGHIYGLVAPCYRMADVVADRLEGKDVEFLGADESADLKLLGIPVSAVGRSLDASAGGVVIKNEDESGYRKLILDQGRLMGATSVGQWDDLDRVRVAIGQQQRLWPHQRRRFSKFGRISPAGSSVSVLQWPADATVCSCRGVTRLQITSALESGADTVEALSQQTAAGTACGSCVHLLEQAIGEEARSQPIPGAKAVLIASAACFILALLIGILPPIPFAESVQSGWRKIDFLWRDVVAKQVTGYSLLTLTVVGLLFSVRKRTNLLKFGSYAFWRTAHVVLGVAILLSVGLHTGLRLGANLNLALSSVFLALTAVGALAGIASGLESKLSGEWLVRIRAWRPRLTRWHIWLFSPVPLLIAAHIFCVYWF